METTAFAALSLGAVWLYTRPGLTGWSALLFGLASQVRPEGHALFALAGLDAVIAYWRAGLRLDMVKRLLTPLLVYGLISLPYVAFSLATTGKPLPNTFYAKIGAAHLFSGRTFRETLNFHLWDNVAAFFLLLAGAAAGLAQEPVDVVMAGGTATVNGRDHRPDLASRPLHHPPHPFPDDRGGGRRSLVGREGNGGASNPPETTAFMASLHDWFFADGAFAGGRWSVAAERLGAAIQPQRQRDIGYRRGPGPLAGREHPRRRLDCCRRHRGHWLLVGTAYFGFERAGFAGIMAGGAPAGGPAP
ncbi:MAG: hypothetical protein M5U34_14950 [Chloroflexi bacterium]|nr:hypothetical protein [Chloroflexota bacterium]